MIHASSIVDPSARIGDGVRIGPYCTIGSGVELDAGCELISNVAVAGRTVIGASTRVCPFVSLGHAPQDLHYRDEPTALRIGRDCDIHEGVTINLGTANGTGVTIIGDRCVFQAGAHVAHDCRIGSDVVLTNRAMLAGHCKIGDFAVLGAGSGVHQYVRVGQHASISSESIVLADVIPYGAVIGNRANLQGLNIAGLRRHGFSPDQIHDLRRAYRLLFAAEGTFAERLDDVAEEFPSHPTVQEILDFIRPGSERSFCMPSMASY